MATITKSLTIESQGTYNLTFDLWSYSEWAASAGITTSYASLAALIADEKAVRQLMTVHASVDYFANCPDSTTISTVINNNLCAKWINLRDYAFDTLSAKSNIKSVMDTADKYGYGEWGIVDSTTTPPTWGALGNVPIMTGNNAPYGVASASSASTTNNPAWKAFDGNYDSSAISNNDFWIPTTGESNNYIRYDFINPVKASKFIVRISEHTSAPSITFKIQGSNDGFSSDIHDLKSFTITNTETNKIQTVEDTIAETDRGYYMSYRLFSSTPLYVTGSYQYKIITLQFYGRELKPLVPIMTANDKPKGTVTYSSQYDTNWAAWKAFDESQSGGWLPSSSDTFANNYVQYEFDKSQKINKCAFWWTSGGSYRASATAKIYGSVDDISYTEIGTVTAIQNTGKNIINIIEGNYKAIKCNIASKAAIDSGASTDLLGGNGYKFQAYGMDYSEKEFASGSNRLEIYDHGVELEEIEGIALGNGIGSKESDQLYVKDTSGAASGYYFATKNTIDFSNSNFSRLCAYNGNKLGAGEGSSSPNGAIAVNTIKSGFAIADPTAYKYMASANKVSEFPVTLDISSVNGNLYVVFFEYSGNSNRYGSCKEIWLE